MNLSQIERVHAVAYFARIQPGYKFNTWVLTVPGTQGCLHKVNVFLDRVPATLSTSCSCRSHGRCYHAQGALYALLDQWYDHVRFLEVKHRRVLNLGLTFQWRDADTGVRYGYVQAYAPKGHAKPELAERKVPAQRELPGVRA